MQIYSFTYYCIVLIVNGIISVNPQTNSWIDSERDDMQSKMFYPVKRRVYAPDKLQNPITHEENSEEEIDQSSLVTSRPLYKPQSYYKPVSVFQRYQERPGLVSPVDSQMSPLKSINSMGSRYAMDTSRKIAPYAIVYGSGRPIGILQPFPPMYGMSPENHELAGVNARDQPIVNILYPPYQDLVNLPLDEENKEELYQEDSAKFTDEQYPNIFTNFKIRSRLKLRQKAGAPFDTTKKLNSDNQDDDSTFTKRDTEVTSNNDYQKFKNSDIRRMADAKNSPYDDIPNSRTTLHVSKNDVSKLNDKREMSDLDQAAKFIDTEDEDLESGANRIEMIREFQGDAEDKRDKRNNNENQSEACDANNKKKVENKVNARKDLDENNGGAEENKFNAQKTDKIVFKRKIPIVKTAPVRGKRKDKGDVTNPTENTDVMKGLEVSGDLTVSGNKSPLISVTTNTDVTDAKNKDNFSNNQVVNEEVDDTDRVARNIQIKIDEIKENIKREKPPEKNSGQERNKRQVYSLLDEENLNIDPCISGDESLVPHIRKRRNITSVPSSVLQELGQNVTNSTKASEQNVMNITSSDKQNQNLMEKESCMKKAVNKLGTHAIANVESMAEGNLFSTNENRSGRNSDDIKSFQIRNVNNSSQRIKRNIFKKPKLPTIDYEKIALQNPIYNADFLKDPINFENYNKNDGSYREQNVPLTSYREEEEEIDDEGDEFDDDSFDDRTADLVDSGQNNAPFNFMDIEQNDKDSQDYTIYDNLKKDGNLNQDKIFSYSAPQLSYGPNSYADENDPPYVRKKRFNAGSQNDLASTRLKSGELKNSDANSKINYYNYPSKLTDMTDTEIFGALPQSYEGELSRFKRIKRNPRYVKN